MTQNQRIPDWIAVRLAERLAHDAAAASAARRFDAATAKLEHLAPAFKRELAAAVADWSNTALSVAWLDGWYCGLNPALLVNIDEEGNE